ncbi:hypothetical protein [Telluribacter humicola]|uniref:hypothetical protein n=1 Tax=Telluribacter humicola TaxID=1720261 RepID=UPI001A958886|nr:hypothetical protein [Telluribacter humicola]
MSRSILLITVVLAACQAEQKETARESGADSYCFRTTFPAGAPSGQQDVTELRWEVAEDGSISGIYNRIPAEKDSRTGTITGKLEEEPIDGLVVHATYKYQQEGTQSEEKINIVVRENQAIVLPVGEYVWVNGVAYPREAALNDTLRRVDCSEITTAASTRPNE